MPEIRAKLDNIRNVELKAKVVDVKDQPSKIVTAVKFEYEGEPSAMEEILMLEAQGHPVNAEIFSPQAAMVLED